MLVKQFNERDKEKELCWLKKNVIYRTFYNILGFEEFEACSYEFDIVDIIKALEPHIVSGYKYEFNPNDDYKLIVDMLKSIGYMVVKKDSGGYTLKEKIRSKQYNIFSINFEL